MTLGCYVITYLSHGLYSRIPLMKIFPVLATTHQDQAKDASRQVPSIVASSTTERYVVCVLQYNR